MSNQVYLISENWVRTMSSISDNTQSKFLLPVIREAQDFDLQPTIGSCLYNHIKELVNNNEIGAPENAVYKDLLDIAQYQLLYGCLERLCLLTSAKISNVGAYQNQEQGTRPFTLNEIFKLQDGYKNKKDFYTKVIQRFCLENQKSLPELKPCDCDNIKANLYSAASTNLWLGGMRGRYYTPIRDKYIYK